MKHWFWRYIIQIHVWKPSSTPEVCGRCGCHDFVHIWSTSFMPKPGSR